MRILHKFDKFITEAAKKKVFTSIYDNIPSFTDEECNDAVIKINDICTVFKDEGLVVDIDTTSFKVSGLTDKIQIHIKFGFEMFLDEDNENVNIESFVRNFSEDAHIVNLINDELENFLMKLNDFFRISSLQSDGSSDGIRVNLGKKA